MIEKPDWLFKGAIVEVFGKKATITKCPTNELKNKIYVYNCDIRYEDKTFSVPVHPSDIKQLEQ